MIHDFFQIIAKSILFNQWDPIGIKETDAPLDEYDSYLDGITRMIRRGAASSDLATHLLDIERREMGLAGDVARAARVAAALIASLPNEG